MVFRHLRFLALLPSLIGPAAAETVAEPPLWANLAECSAVFAAVAQDDGYAGATNDEIARAEKVASAFLDRAVTAAGAAGQADPQGDVASVMDYLVPRWQGRIGQLFSVKSNLDWIGYCGRLGRSEAILPLPPEN